MILAGFRQAEQAAIRAMLSKRAEGAPAGAGVGRAAALAWAGWKLAATVLLAAGVAVGLGDGDEFDDVGCSVYTARYGVPPVGTKVFVSVSQMVDGWEERPETFAAVVPASA